MKNRPGLPLLLAAALAAGCASAAESPTQNPDAQRLAALEQKLAQSQRMIEQMAADLHDLQQRLDAQHVAAPAPAPAGSADPERLAQVEREVAQINAASAGGRSDDRGLPLHGFADVGVGNHNPFTADLKGAGVGSVDFYLAPQLGERTRGLVELNFEVGEDGGVGVDLERAQLGYQAGNAGTVWLGRFHTPYGYWNTAFHHGQQIATSLRRPRFLAFEDQGGILPAHTVGAWLTGTVRRGEARLGYDFYVGNAQRIDDTGTLDMMNAGTPDGQVTVGGRVSLQPAGALSDLSVGLSGLSTRVTNVLDPANPVRLNVLAAHLAWDSDDWESLAEYYWFHNQALGAGGTHASNAGYVQVGYRAGRFTPYVRFERTSLDQSDGYFAAQASGGSYRRSAFGLRFDLDLKSALKIELADTQQTDRARDSHGDALLQYAVRF